MLEPSRSRGLIVAVLVIIGLLVSVAASGIAAFKGAEIAGSRPGGWNWQYLPALYGGMMWGGLSYALVCPILWQREWGVVRTIVVSNSDTILAARLDRRSIP
jgi:hypothetical protein